VLRIAVPIKQVATLDDEVELDREATTVDADYLEFELNEWDNFSLEAALQIKEAAVDGDAEVVVITVGDEEAEEGLLACLAKGADRAVRIWDEDLPPIEPLWVASLLASAIRREEIDLVLCGVQSSDAASSATGAALAGLLDLPHTAVARSLRFDAAEKRIAVDRELEGGLIEQISLPTPALVTVQTGANEPRYANLRAIKQAASKPIARLGLDDFGLDIDAVVFSAGSRTVALRHPPRSERRASMLEGDAASVASQLLDLLNELVPDREGANA
jgi:electron transfer flavoprotein beta subunit